jgi:chemotaxis family two-component system response regulator Rcp1
VSYNSPKNLEAKPPMTHMVLLVEDNTADVQIVQRVLRDSGRAVELIVTRDGQEGLDYLLRQGKFAQAPTWRRPDLVLADLNLPRLTGRELVGHLRKDPLLRNLPVVIWTTSRRPEDVQEVYAAGANTYVEKPREFGRLQQVLQTILSYWLDTAVLPASSEAVKPA